MKLLASKISRVIILNGKLQSNKLLTYSLLSRWMNLLD